MNMIERVARALCGSMVTDGECWECQCGEGPCCISGMDALAKVVITAMREPTNDMLDANLTASDYPDCIDCIDSPVLRWAWQAMIDAALAEPRDIHEEAAALERTRS